MKTPFYCHKTGNSCNHIDTQSMIKNVACCDCERYLNDKPKDTSYHVFIKSLILAGFIIAVLFGMIIICAIQLLKQ